MHGGRRVAPQRTIFRHTIHRRGGHGGLRAGPQPGTSNISLIGTFLGTNWDVDYQLAEVETNVYVIKHVTLTDTDKFKIRFNGNWDVNRGTEVENFDVELNKGFAVVEHGKDVIPHWNGTYDIWYNQAKEQMAVVEKDGQPVWADQHTR